MTAAEILALIQSARSLLELGIGQYRLAEQEGRITADQRAAILKTADLTDEQVDRVIDAARRRLGKTAD